MKKLFLMSLVFLSTMLAAQKPVEIKLWPNGAPNTNNMTQQVENGPLYVAEPTLTVYTAKEGNGMAIVACPGGGYTHLAMNHEGHDLANWFNSQGITYAVLTYRMPNGNNEVPLSDAQQALRIMRQHAAEWNIQQVGIMGSSAGGHLASTAATHFTDAETRPDFQILFYPVITMDPTYTHMGSHDNLLGKNPSKELEQKYSNELQVTPQTPPAFIMHSSDDGAVPVANSVNYYMALVKNKVSASLHTYPIGGHGWGFRDSFIYKRQWTGELEKWLREINNK
jgi:acetyl esterase/lipase